MDHFRTHPFARPLLLLLAFGVRLSTFLFPAAGLGTHAVQAQAQRRPTFIPVVTSSNQGLSSETLIEQALSRGEIGAETALRYRVFAVFGDPRLPSHLRGEDSGLDGSGVLEDLQEALPQLSPGAQAELAPFLLPPTLPGSWHELHEDAARARSTWRSAAPASTAWATLDAQATPVKIWYQQRYPEDQARAQAISNEIDTVIWPKLATLMQRTPLPDCGATCPEGGSDTRLDIYLVNLPVDGIVSALDYKNAASSGSSAYMKLKRNASMSTVAHELMHVFQKAFPTALSEYKWLKEATAVWAEDYVYPNAQDEHVFAPELLSAPQLPLESTRDEHEYGAYLFPFFLINPTIVRQIFERAKMPNSLENLDGLIAGGFAEQWPRFTLYNWNRPPVDVYSQIDKLPHVAGASSNYISTPTSTPFSVEVPHLAAQYTSFTFVNSNIRKITVFNPVAELEAPRAHVWAIAKIDGVWMPPEDWTTVKKREYCLDKPGENLEQIVLIFSNSEWQDRNSVLKTSRGLVTTELSCGACERTKQVTQWRADFTVSYADSDTATKGGVSWDTTVRRAGSYSVVMRGGSQPGDTAQWRGDQPEGTVSIDDKLIETASGTTNVYHRTAAGAPDSASADVFLDGATCTARITSAAVASVTGDGGTVLVGAFMYGLQNQAMKDPLDPQAPLVFHGDLMVAWPTTPINPETETFISFGATEASGALQGIRFDRGASNAGTARVTWRLTAIAP